MKTTYVGIIDTNVKSSILEHGYEVHNIEMKIRSNKYEPKVTLEDKVYPKTYYRHSTRECETLTKIKA